MDFIYNNLPVIIVLLLSITVLIWAVIQIVSTINNDCISQLEREIKETRNGKTPYRRDKNA